MSVQLPLPTPAAPATIAATFIVPRVALRTDRTDQYAVEYAVDFLHPLRFLREEFPANSEEELREAMALACASFRYLPPPSSAAPTTCVP